MEVQLEATRTALELRMERSREEARACDEQQRLLQQANEEQRQQLARRDAERDAWLAEKATLLGQQADLAASVDEMASALQALAAYRDIASARVEQLRSLQERTAPLLTEGEVQLALVDGHAALVLASDPLFGRSSGQMSRKGQGVLQGAALVLRGLGAEVLVAVHDPQGTDDLSPLGLTAQRAIAVAEVLERAGLPRERLAVAGFGASQGGEARVELRVLPDYEAMPGVLGMRETLAPPPVAPVSAAAEGEDSPSD